MEVVVLKDMVAAYASNWIPVANSKDIAKVQVKDRFREQGFGGGAEELEVEGIDLSPVSGASRIYFRRAANNTQAEVHRLGAVFEATTRGQFVRTDGDGIEQAVVESAVARITPLYAAAQNHTLGGTTNTAVGIAEPEEPETIIAGGTEYANPKRGRGRPPGSKNKPKAPMQMPSWPGVS